MVSFIGRTVKREACKVMVGTIWIRMKTANVGFATPRLTRAATIQMFEARCLSYLDELLAECGG